MLHFQYRLAYKGLLRLILLSSPSFPSKLKGFEIPCAGARWLQPDSCLNAQKFNLTLYPLVFQSNQNFQIFVYLLVF